MNWEELLKGLSWSGVLKWTLVPFVVTLQILAVVWIIMHMQGGSDTPITTTVTITETTPTETTTP